MALPLSCSPPPTPSDWTFEQRMWESFRLLDHMRERRVPADPSLLCTLLHFASSHRSLPHTRALHSRVLRLRLHHHTSVATALVSAYAHCGLLPVARHLFDEMPRKTPASWTTAIAMYQRAGLPHESLALYRSMLSSSPDPPNAFTYAAVLGACARANDAVLGRRVHEDASRDGCDADAFVAAALVDMYSKCGSVDDARQVFDALPRPNPVACTAMIDGYNTNGLAPEALEVFRKILRSADEGFVREMGLAGAIKACVLEAAVERGMEVHAYSVKTGINPGPKALGRLVELYEKCGRIALAYRLMRCMGLKNAGLWSGVVIGLVGKGMHADALKAYSEMLVACGGAVECNRDTLHCAVKACAGLQSLEEGRQLHGRAVKMCGGTMEESVAEALFDMYSTCGEAEAAGQLSG